MPNAPGSVASLSYAESMRTFGFNLCFPNKHYGGS